MAADYHLQIDGVEGESVEKGFEKQIQLLSWSFGATNAGTSAHGTGVGGGKVAMQDFHFTMKMNKATPKLFLFCSTGQHIKQAVLTCRKPTGASGLQATYFKVTFGDVLISSYQTGGHDTTAGADIPVESISFNFSTIKLEYSPQKADGSMEAPIPAGYDLKKNTKL